jgi:hypothetical protein
MTKRNKKALRRTAARTTGVIRHVAATKWSAKKQRDYNHHRLGKMGAASEVRLVAIEEEAEHES